MSIQSADELKDVAISIMEELGATDLQWTTENRDGTTTVGLWFFILERWHFTPFSSPWQYWNKPCIDDQIARWMQKTPEKVDEWLSSRPTLKLNVAQVKLCECGAETTCGKNTRHSYWCKLYTPNPYTGL